MCTNTQAAIEPLLTKSLASQPRPFFTLPKALKCTSKYYTDEYQNRLLCSCISNAKRLERQDIKPGGSGALNHQAFRINGGKQKGSKRHSNLHLLNSSRTQRLLHKLRVHQKKIDNPLHRSLLDKASRTASQVRLRPNSPLLLPKKSSKGLYNTRNYSQGRANPQKRQLTTKST